MPRAGLVVASLFAAIAVACGGDAPEATPTAAPSSAGSVARSIVTSDGGRLSAHLFEAASGGRIAILSHQYGADQSSWYEAARRLQASGLSALTFDFRGFGESGGDEDPDTLAIDLEAALAFARAGGFDQIILIGASMGGTASIVAAGAGGEAAANVDAVIALSAPVEFGALHAEDAAASIRVPLLLVAAQGDTSALDSLERIGEAAGVPAPDQVITAGAEHGTELLESPESRAIWRAITRLLEAIWPAGPPA
jgi:alpha-beta hydrolase superfamily lysophospholipase